MSMFSAAELTDLRSMSATAQPDTGTIHRPGAGGSLDVNGVWTPTAETLVYAGPLRVKAASPQDSVAVFGDTEVTSVRHIAMLPFDAPDVRVDDVVHVTAGSDPHIVGVAYRVRAVPHGSFLFERRLGLEVVS